MSIACGCDKDSHTQQKKDSQEIHSEILGQKLLLIRDYLVYLENFLTFNQGNLP